MFGAFHALNFFALRSSKLSKAEKIDLIRKDLRKIGVLLFVAGVIGILVEPHTLYAGIIATLGALFWWIAIWKL